MQGTSSYHHQDVWHNDVLFFAAVGHVWLEEEFPVLQEGDCVIVMKCDICFIPELSAKRWERSWEPSPT